MAIQALESALDNYGNLLIFLVKAIIVLHSNLTGKIGNSGTKDVEIMFPLKYEMP